MTLFLALQKKVTTPIYALISQHLCPLILNQAGPSGTKRHIYYFVGQSIHETHQRREKDNLIIFFQYCHANGYKRVPKSTIMFETVL